MDLILNSLASLVQGFAHIDYSVAIMLIIGCVLLYLAVGRGIEPLLLIPIGFGIVLGNLPLAGLAASDQGGIINIIYNQGILTELFPSLLFIGLGAMIDFGPMLANPTVLIFGAAGQFGIFLTLLLAIAIGWPIQHAVSVAIIGACDGPTSIYMTTKYAPSLLPAVSIAAYSYMSLVPIIQPPIMRWMTSKKERAIVMPYGTKQVSQRVKVLFPLVAGLITMLIAPMGAPLMGMLMLGNFMKESGVLSRLVDVSENTITNVVTLFLGLCIGQQMLFEDSAEGPTPGLALLPGHVRAFEPGAGLKIPHMGWNEVWQASPHALWKGIADGSRFYFVHSFYCEPAEPALTAGTTRYPDGFTSG